MENKLSLFVLMIVGFSFNLFSQSLPLWQRLPNAPFFESGKFEDIFFINDQTGWVVGHTSITLGTVFKTTDGGISWFDQSFPVSSGTYLRCVGFINDSTGWCGNLNPRQNNLMYKTTNGGTNWFVDESIPDSSLSGVCGIWVMDESNVYACGIWSNDAGILKTTDSGNSWKYIDLKPYAKGVVDVFFFSPDTGFVVGFDTSKQSAVVLATEDGGETWSIKHISEHQDEWAWKISFPTRKIGYVSLQAFNGNHHFLKTIDGGNTWEDMPFSAYNNFVPSGIGFISELKGWQGTHPSGTKKGSVETTDGGLTWFDNDSIKNVNKFRIVNDTLAYACGETVYKYTSEIISGVYRETFNYPSDYGLSQNFPNPFNPLTTILFSIPGEQHVQLEVHNVNGELVNTLVDGDLKAGAYEVRFVGSKLVSGVYFYTLKTGNFSQTKKMVLLK